MTAQRDPVTVFPPAAVLPARPMRGMPPTDPHLTLTPSEGALIAVQIGNAAPAYPDALDLLHTVTDLCRRMGLLGTAASTGRGGVPTPPPDRPKP